MRPDGCYSLVLTGMTVPRDVAEHYPESTTAKDWTLDNFTSVTRNVAVSGAGEGMLGWHHPGYGLCLYSSTTIVGASVLRLRPSLLN